MSPTKMLTADDLDLDQLRRLAELSDEAGVLTIVVGHDPARPDEARGAEIAVKSGLQDATEQAEGDLRGRLETRLEELEGEIADLVDPTSFGRGRMLFTSLAPGAPVEVVRVQVPVDHRVVVAEHAWIRPLARAWAQNQPVRVLLLDQDGVQVRDWAMGQLSEGWTREVSFGDAQLADVKSGPAKSPHQRGNVNRERFEDRLDANRSRILRDAVAEARDRAKDAGIERLLVMGAAKVRDLVEPELDDQGLTVWFDERDLSHGEDDVVRRAVAEHVAEAWARDGQDLLRRIRDGEAAGGRATIGLAGVLRALNEGRVDTLVVAEDTDLRGYLTEDGLLSVTPGPEHDRDPVPYLIDRAVAAALATDATVVLIPDDQAAELGDEPIGALLRW